MSENDLEPVAQRLDDPLDPGPVGVREGLGDQALVAQVAGARPRPSGPSGSGLHPLALEPEELVLVVAGGRAVHPVEGEFLDQLGAGEDLLRGVVAPAQPGEVIEQGLGEVALLDVLVQVDEDARLLVLLDLPLGHLGPRAGLGDVRDVGEGRQLGAQGLEDQELREGVGEVLLGADDVGDLHLDVVDRRSRNCRAACRRGGR